MVPDDHESASVDLRPDLTPDTQPVPEERVEVTDKHDATAPPAPTKEARKAAHARSATTTTRKSRSAKRSPAKSEDDVPREEPPQKRSLISQLPFIGPLFGPALP